MVVIHETCGRKMVSSMTFDHLFNEFVCCRLHWEPFCITCGNVKIGCRRIHWAPLSSHLYWGGASLSTDPSPSQKQSLQRTTINSVSYFTQVVPTCVAKLYISLVAVCCQSSLCPGLIVAHADLNGSKWTLQNRHSFFGTNNWSREYSGNENWSDLPQHATKLHHWWILKVVEVAHEK